MTGTSVGTRDPSWSRISVCGQYAGEAVDGSTRTGAHRLLPGVLVQVFLWPVGAYAVLLPLAILFGFNPTRFTLNIYFG